jgi:hypothetical protein
MGAKEKVAMHEHEYSSVGAMIIHEIDSSKIMLILVPCVLAWGACVYLGSMSMRVFFLLSVFNVER